MKRSYSCVDRFVKNILNFGAFTFSGIFANQAQKGFLIFDIAQKPFEPQGRFRIIE